MVTRIAVIAVGLVLTAITAVPAFGQASPQAHRALMVRGYALDVTYGLGKPAAMTDAAYRAVLIRSAAMNERYGLPVALTANETARLYGTGVVLPVTEPTAGNGFDWGDAATGAAVVLGLVALGAGGAWMMRGHGHMPHPHH